MLNVAEAATARRVTHMWKVRRFKRVHLKQQRRRCNGCATVSGKPRGVSVLAFACSPMQILGAAKQVVVIL
jgi:hypothetical protein